MPVFVVFFAQSDITVLSKNTNDSSDKFIRTIHSENDVEGERVGDFDAETEEVDVLTDSPINDYAAKNNIFPEGSPSITFERYPTQGKKASELLPGEWMFDQEFARGLLFENAPLFLCLFVLIGDK